MTWKGFHLTCLFWLVVFNSPRADEAMDVRDLRISSEDDSDVTEKYFHSGSDVCRTSINFNEPELSGPSVAKPAFLDAQPFESDLSSSENDKSVYGAKFEWQSPKTGRNHLNGFYVQIEGKPSICLCRLYILKPSENSIPLNFTFSANNLATTNSYYVYTVKVYSLPRDQKSDSNPEYAFKVVSHFPKQDYEYPGNWKPAIQYNTTFDPSRKGRVCLSFEYPPKREDWNLTKFKVYLMRTSDPKGAIIKHLRRDLNSNETHASHCFNELPDDYYHIQVNVVNDDESRTKLCICRKEYNICGISCTSTRTWFFDFHGYRSIDGPNATGECELLKPTPKRPSKPPDTTTVSTSTAKRTTTTDYGTGASDNKSTGIAVDVALAIICGIIVVIGVLTAMYLWRRKQDGCQLTFKLYPSSKKNGSPFDLDNYRVVYIMAVTNSPESCLLVESFCTFLKTYCHCSVINPREADLSEMCESAWVTSMIQRCDSIIFINSIEAAKLIDHFINNTKIDMDPNHSMFYKALQVVFNAKLTCNFNLVTFTEDWTKDTLAVLCPKKFTLPKQLPRFTRELHNLTKSMAQELANHLPFSLGDMANNLEWENVLLAVKKVKMIEKSNTPLPACTTSESNQKSITLIVDNDIDMDKEEDYLSNRLAQLNGNLIVLPQSTSLYTIDQSMSHENEEKSEKSLAHSSNDSEQRQMIIKASRYKLENTTENDLGEIIV